MTTRMIGGVTTLMTAIRSAITTMTTTSKMIFDKTLFYL